MWGSWWQDLLLGLAAGLLLAWVALIAVLVIVRPRGGLLREALRLLPDLLRLLPRLAADRSLPRRVRVGLALLLAYLAFPFDPVPDLRAERHPFAPWRYGRWRLNHADVAADSR